ncbi:MAG: ATP-binding protein [Proteobacteria bacterium]|nr:ATP-binding protein [Pseudomonadota bacterium]
MDQISLHILDIAENAVTVGARLIQIILEKDEAADRLRISILDDGPGLSPEQARQAADPFYTTRTTRRVGLGLPLARQTAEQSGGSFHIASRPGRGTNIDLEFGLSHLDRPPLGDMGATLMTLIVGRPEMDFLYRQKTPAGEFIIDTREIRAALGDVPLSDPEVIRVLRDGIREGMAELGIV